MRKAETVLRHRLLESRVIRKSVKRGSEGGGWKSAHLGNSLAAYPTARTVLRGDGCRNAPLLPGIYLSVRTCDLDVLSSSPMRVSHIKKAINYDDLTHPTMICPQSCPIKSDPIYPINPFNVDISSSQNHQ